MHRTELNIGGHLFEVSGTECDKLDSSSLKIIHSKILRIISVARSSAFPEGIRMCSLVISLMNWNNTDALLGIQYL